MTQRRIPVKLILESFHDGLDDKRKDELNSWLAQGDNVSIYEGIQHLWEDKRSKAENYLPDHDYLWNELNDMVRKEESKRHKRKVRIISVTTSIAAALILGIVLFPPILQKVSDQETLATVTALSGETQTTLPDGTDILLADGSSINYDLRKFDKKERSVTLSGKAMFDVGKNPDKPFIVSVDRLKIKVTGTKFLVDEEQEQVIVSLKEGAVIMENSRGVEMPMIPGDVTEFDKLSEKIHHLASGIPTSINWNKDKLTFTRNNMGEICNALSQWYGIPIRTSAQLENSFAYTFIVTNETIEDILDFICKINHLSYQRQPDGSYLIR